MKTIWIVNYYAMPPEYDVWYRHFEFAKILKREGYNVRVFCSGFIYGYNIDLVPSNQKYIDTEYSGVPYTLIKVPSSEGNGAKRIYSIFEFACRLKSLRNNWERPDIIYHNQRAPFDYPIVSLSKKIKARYIVEIWDLWPHDFVRNGMISSRNPFMQMAYCLERKMYEAATDIIYTFPGGIDYLRMQKWTTSSRKGKINPKQVHYINNGINLTDFYRNIQLHPTNDPDLNDTSKFKVIYLGSINMTNNVRQLIEAAKLLRDDKRIVFLIYGNGAEKQDLVKYVKENNIYNVLFKSDRIPYHDCAYIVSNASLNIMNYKENVGRLGVSTGKLFQYMAAGKPILCNVKVNYSPFEKYHCGIDGRFNDPCKYAEAIRCFVDMPKEEYDKMCENAKNAAKDFDYGVLCQKLIKVIEDYYL